MLDLDSNSVIHLCANKTIGVREEYFKLFECVQTND